MSKSKFSVKHNEHDVWLPTSIDYHENETTNISWCRLQAPLQREGTLKNNEYIKQVDVKEYGIHITIGKNS